MVAEVYEDSWMKGIRLQDMAVSIVSYIQNQSKRNSACVLEKSASGCVCVCVCVCVCLCLCLCLCMCMCVPVMLLLHSLLVTWYQFTNGGVNIM